MMYECFGLVLMVTHACNLRCSYCYTGGKSPTAISPTIGRTAIDRAMRSIRPGGTLELGFFGGEPFLDGDLVVQFLEYARRGCDSRGICLRPTATTNGIYADGAARRAMSWPDMQLSVSHDGLPEVHDRHRRDINGRGTSARVLDTIAQLLDASQEVCVVMVVRPDNVALLTDGIAFLLERGVRHFSPTLDLWTRWTDDDLLALEAVLVCCSNLWRERLPSCSISWFDEKAAQIAGIDMGITARCGFGDGEVAVAPSGNLYPCERLIGEDRADNPMRLAGHALKGEDFRPQSAPERSAKGCAACAIRSQCSTTCRCSNYIRTGDLRRPDGLLCLLDRVCYRETARIMRELQSETSLPPVQPAERVGP